MNTKKRLILPGIAVGLLILILAVVLKPSPILAPGYDKAVAVDVLPLTMSEISPQIEAFGRVEPKHVWQAVAEVGGKVVYRHPQLETGRLLSKDTLVLAIDPLEYQLKLAQAEASLNATQAQITRLDQQERNLNTSLKIEKQKLALAEQEYQRKLTLKKRDLVSSSELENQKQSLLAQTKLVEDLQSSLNLLPDDRKVSLAQENVDKALLQDAERRLLQTKVVLPFDARISNVNIEQDQVVGSGSVMLVAHQLGTAEVKAELSVQDMRTLVSSFLSDTQPLSMPSIERFDIQAEVVFQSGGNRFSWPAKVTRVSDTVNLNQGTIGVYLEVEQDFHQLDLLTRPPLTKGMFVSAILYGQSRSQFVIPERALHGRDVYLMDKDNRLVIKPVEVLYRHQQRVAISGDFAQGDVVVLNDLIPAIAGMSLKLVNGNLQRNSASGEPQKGDTGWEADQ
ncbi:efflux RND transporter periplasmic adaptor subunit [Shewanella psychrotolerans]|uniref:efflux RND transporter periplasmic adaptor subunit n=1 Tax=Shewanella psychrotolerans TaxID=2864206 RepID=UPI001C6619EB|nr:HlyD family efflux transporter periplasmic adaptor subunit [Shewanella psychrotolerans]QYK01642.1 HlyD family efflux transporter periplasmic adaptor subunit [Shewanella psychrotolerans]